jgi:hypothetical protein
MNVDLADRHTKTKIILPHSNQGYRGASSLYLENKNDSSLHVGITNWVKILSEHLCLQEHKAENRLKM